MTDIAGKLADRLVRLDNHLAIVLSVHLFVEYLLDRLIDERSPIAKKILDDRRTYTFAVKLTVVFHLQLLEQSLYDNLVALNGLRNAYAHEIDVELTRVIDKGFKRSDGSPLFASIAGAVERIRNDPREGVLALMEIKDATFGWLHAVATRQGVRD